MLERAGMAGGFSGLVKFLLVTVLMLGPLSGFGSGGEAASLEEARLALERELMAVPGFAGIAHSVSEEKIIVYLEDAGALGIAPDSFLGYGVQKIVSGGFYALGSPVFEEEAAAGEAERLGRVSALVGGISLCALSRDYRAAGTLGAVTWDDMILSSAHVIAMDGYNNFLDIGSAVTRPGSGGGDIVGNLADYVGINFTRRGDPDCEPNLVDAAVATLGADGLAGWQYGEDGNYQIGGFAAVDEGDVLRKSGRTTGVTQNKVEAANFSGWVGYGGGDYAYFVDQIVVINPFGAGGDAGSAADKDGAFAGLLFAGSGSRTILNKAEHIIDLLDVDLGPAAVMGLTVKSQNPSSWVRIAVWPPDIDGRRDGSTTFTRRYPHNRVVELHAPAVSSRNEFSHWLIDGRFHSYERNIRVGMDRSKELTAVYRDDILTVTSQNPSSWVDIAVWPVDKNGRGGGRTTFTRRYHHNRVVLLHAPLTAGGNSFSHWLVDGRFHSFERNIPVAMDRSKELTAVYRTQRTLTVASKNPSSGVDIAVWPADNEGRGGGATKFVRRYPNNRVVELHAPATAGGNTFSHWLANGRFHTFERQIKAGMTADMELTAVYATQRRTLRVSSLNPVSGVPIEAMPPDIHGEGDGSTAFARQYFLNTIVELEAPLHAGGGKFEFDHWLVNDRFYSFDRRIRFGMISDMELTAVYRTLAVRELRVTSINPLSGVYVQVSPTDIDGKYYTDRHTTFTRRYYDKTRVELIAAEWVYAPYPRKHDFSHWLVNGSFYSFERRIDFNMIADTEMTAVYRDPD